MIDWNDPLKYVQICFHLLWVAAAWYYNHH